MKRYSKACERNQQPIGDRLQDWLADARLVLEVGSGTGQHAVAFARRFPHLTWQPTNPPGQLQSVEAWRRDADLPNLQPALAFDLFNDAPPVDGADAIIAINVIHIAPARALPHLFGHAAALLDSGAPLILYGPYRYDDRPLEPSNERFHQHLKQRHPDMGIRLFEEVDRIASEHGFEHRDTHRLPANNDLHRWIRR